MPKDVMEMTAGELRVLRDGLPDDHDAHEMRMLNDRITDVSIAEGLAQGFLQQKEISRAETLDAAAKKRYSGLRDTDSEFAKAVDKELEERGDSKTNARALMDAANSVAMDMGVKPDAWNEPAGQSNSIRGSGSRNNFGDEVEAEGMSDRQKELMAGLIKRGYLDPKNKASMDRITKATGGEIEDE